jgi:hypothetical protein
MIQLCANQYSIEIETTNTGWCKCWLIIDGNKTYLGAESQKYLKEHLLTGLVEGPKEISGHLYKFDFGWLLFMKEVHTALYVANDGLGRALLLQNVGGHANEICLIKLSEEQCLQWLDQIRSI